MSKKYNFLILIVVIAMSLLVWLLVKYYAYNPILKITDKHIGNLDIQNAVDELDKRGHNLTKDQYKQILIGMAVYSNLKVSEMNKDKTDPFFEYVDIFTTSFKNFLFSYKNGITTCLDSNDIYIDQVKKFLNFLLEFSDTLTMPEIFSTYLDKFGVFRDTVHNLYDKDIIKGLSNEIQITVENEKKTYSIGDIVLGSIFVQVLKVIKPKETNK